MAHRLDPHYMDFGGLDVSTSPLLQNEKSARDGSRNWRWSVDDKLQKMEGFQHKTAQGDAAEAGLIEYKYQDVNTGQSLTQVLGVSFDGKLRRLLKHRLQLTRTTLSSVVYYSLYYDAPNATFKIEFLSSTFVVLGSVNISTVQTLDQLKTAINTLALTGLTADVVDESGTPVTSSVLAYLLNVVYREEFQTTSTDIEYNDAWYWEEVSTPDGNVPFVNAVTYKDDPNYEGITYVNANNSVYITDGGFPFKYDGKTVYRAGIPKTPMAAYSDLGYNGIQMAFASGAGWTAGEHFFRIGIKYKDINGVVTVGKIQPIGQDFYYLGTPTYPTGAYFLTAGASGSLNVGPRYMQNGAQFPIYSCKIDGDQTVGTASGTYVLDVDTGHRIVVGMALRIDYTPIAVSQYTVSSSTNVYYAEVTAVTATTVTIDVPIALLNSITLYDNTCVQGVYVPDSMFGKSGDPASSAPLSFDWYGAYYVLYATKADVSFSDTYYEAGAFPIPHDAAHEYAVRVETLDAALIVPVGDDGEDLPRACKYLQKWQDQIIQAGRPPAAETLRAEYYPTLYNDGSTLGPPYNNGSLGVPTEKDEFFATYSEAHMCDFQSIYWADVNNPEGFPQSGANEEDFENVFNDAVTGMYPNKEALFVFKDRTTAYLTGTLATGDLVKEFLEADIGCATQNSIQEVRGAVVFMDKNLGFWSVVSGRLPEFIGYPIQDYFKNNDKQSRSAFLNFKKAKAANYRFSDQYWCYIPAGKKEEGESGVMPDPTSSSVAFVFDYSAREKGYRSQWYAIKNINAAGGVLATADDELIISQKETSNNRLWKQKLTGSIYDFSNNTSAIEFNYKGAFLSYKKPTVDKHFERCWISSVLGGFSLRVDQYMNFIDVIQGSLTITFPALSSSKKAVKDYVKANIPKLSGISWGFYNNEIHEDVQIDGWEVEFSADFDVGEPKQ